MKPVVFVDLDGVLADFVRGAFRHHGRSLPITDVRWDFPQQIGFSDTWASSFWDTLDYEFWLNLDPLEDGFKLLQAVEDAVGVDAVALLSSPCDTAGCAEGKRVWVSQYLPQYKRRLFLGSAKELFASPTKVLIDDHDVNCDRFIEHGGRSVLVPRPWNRRRQESNASGEFCPVQMKDEVATIIEAMK